jgi:hydroxymethylpyrimidine pyrophosphatase-like HAD family hydrolase
MALLGLTRHGYRPVVATGRSLAEVRERCGYYRLSGGVAEYGAVVYSHLSGRTRTLLSPEGEAALAELRAVLRGLPGVHVDPAFEHSVRAYRIEHDARVGLDQATVEAVLARVRSSGRPRALAARSQTDFVAEGIDKGSGLKVLAEELGEDRIALAVGDTIHDLPMLVLAERAGVPSNADADVCRLASARGARVDAAARPYGAGLLELVSRLLGHRPGRCAMCASPLVEDDSDRALLLSVLGALDGGAREKSRQVAVLGALLAKRERR